MRRIPVSGQRRMMLWFYDEPSNDPYVSFTVDVDLEPALAFLDAFEREHGQRAGVQHLVTAAVARCLHDLPAINVKIAGRSFYQLDRVHLAVPVHLASEAATDDQTGLMVLRDVDRKSLLDIARDTRAGARAERSGSIQAFGSAVARRLWRHAPRAAEATMDLAGRMLRNPTGLRLLGPWAGIGSVVTNVGSVFSLPAGARFRSVAFTLPAKLGHVASAFGLAPACDAPVAEGGKVVVRRVLPIVMAVDHRAIDGYLMAKVGEHVASSLLDPARLAGPARRD